MGNREDLLAGAKRCLAERGYGRTTVRDIAGEAGVSMAAIGYHFGSREDLLNAALLESIDELGDEMFGQVMPAAAEHDEHGSMVDTETWDRMFASLAEKRTLWLSSLEATLQAEQTPALRRQMAAGHTLARQGLAARLTGVEEDHVDVETARTLGSVYFALISGLMIQWQTDPESTPSGAEVANGLRRLATIIDESDA